MKSEPDVWSIDQQKKAGNKGAPWDGVRNHQAAKNLRNMKTTINKANKTKIAKATLPNHTSKLTNYQFIIPIMAFRSPDLTMPELHEHFTEYIDIEVSNGLDIVTGLFQHFI